MSTPRILFAERERQPRRYRSTGLSILSRHCPYALDQWERGVPYDRALFEVGISAHAVLQAAWQAAQTLGRSPSEEEVEAIGAATFAGLVSGPRIFDGHPEPPLDPDRAREGRELALDWLIGQEPPTPGAEIEVGLALDKAGEPVPYSDPSAYYTAILDQVRVEQRTDEESSARVLTIRDYKTSWHADDAELTTIQRRGQAVVAWPHYGEGVDVLRLEVVNLRTRRIHAIEFYAEDGLDEQIAEWKRDLWQTLAGLDEQANRGRRPARPGAGCMGCPFVLACDFAADYMERGEIPRTARERAIAYAVAVATTERLADAVRLDCGDGSLEVPGGVVGFVGRERRQAKDDAHATLAESWPGADTQATRGLLKAIGLSVKSLEGAARSLYPTRQQKAEREALLRECLTTVTVPVFGVHKQADKEAANDVQSAA